MRYRHTQTGILGPIVAGTLVVIVIAVITGAAPPLGQSLLLVAFAVVMTLVLLAFNRLTVTVDDEAVTATFGWGWPRRRIDLADIDTAAAVRNSWWYGYGIRLTPRGWMFNVWGLDAVEIRMTDGRAFRIGTDEPGDLVAALDVPASA